MGKNLIISENARTHSASFHRRLGRAKEVKGWLTSVGIVVPDKFSHELTAMLCKIQKSAVDSEYKENKP